jgi:hypothetical protein
MTFGRLGFRLVQVDFLHVGPRARCLRQTRYHLARHG